MNILLTDNQKEVVNYIDGNLLVLAGPRSGKTTVITERIVNLLRNNKKRILTLTFSNNSSDEIKRRLKKLISDELFNDLYVGTIHNFCMEVVINRGNLIGLPDNLTIIQSDDDKINILKKAILDSPILKYKLYEKINEKGFLESCLSKIKELKLNFDSYDSLYVSDSQSDDIYLQLLDSYNRILLSNRNLDFEDIFYYAYKIFSERPQIAEFYTKLYKYILIDEVQDFNLAQYQVIKALCVNFNNIMMVGDPNQALYRLNDSEYQILIESFKEDFEPQEIYLKENFRSAKKIVNAAKKLRNDLLDNNSYYPIEGEFNILNFENELIEANWIINSINSFIKENIRYKNIAVIARNRYVYKVLMKKLKEAKIPFNSGPINKIQESESVLLRIFELGMKIIVNPYDKILFNHLMKLIKYQEKFFDKNNFINLLNIDEKCLDTDVMDIFIIAREALKIVNNNEEDFLKSLEYINNNIPKNINENEKYFIENDIDTWKKYWLKYTSRTTTKKYSLKQFISNTILDLTQTNDLYGVSLLTVNMSKGLEFDVVYVMGLNEGTFPDYRFDIEDEINDLYVAITRAKKICYLTYIKYKQMPSGELKQQTPSRFISILEK